MSNTGEHAGTTGYFLPPSFFVDGFAYEFGSKFGKLSSGHSTEKGQFSFQSQRKAMPKMFKLPLHSSHTLVK